ncbi:MAG TPA: helix-turn-helix domain-containing protein [Alphaproteobacteria bacterium]
MCVDTIAWALNLKLPTRRRFRASEQQLADGTVLPADIGKSVPLARITRAKLVLISLANARNHQSGECHPTIRRISEETQLSRSTVRRALEDLRNLGLISWEPRYEHEAEKTAGRVIGQIANSYKFHGDWAEFVSKRKWKGRGKLRLVSS